MIWPDTDLTVSLRFVQDPPFDLLVLADMRSQPTKSGDVGICRWEFDLLRDRSGHVHAIGRGAIDTTNFVPLGHFESLCMDPLITAQKFTDIIPGEHRAHCDPFLDIFHSGCPNLLSVLRDLAFLDVANHLVENSQARSDNSWTEIPSSLAGKPPVAALNGAQDRKSVGQRGRQLRINAASSSQHLLRQSAT